MTMEKISVFLLLVGVLEFVSKNPSFGIEINNKCSTLFHKVKGKVLSGHVISVHQASSEIACTQKCLSNPKCASFNFEIQQSRSLTTCELNAVSRTSPSSKLKSRHGFAYYEPLTLRGRPEQQIKAFSPTTSNLMMAASTTQGTQEVRSTQDQTTTPARRVPSTQPTITGAPGKYYIGLNDLQGTGTYKWADGTNASFTNWNTGFPRGGKGVVMKLNGTSDDGKWQTKNVIRAMRFICECPDGPCA
ncbi:uncharacterized protein LOC122962993 [Acropora millepora]|uniref:uncharacterized protein LOC122962993 n=1 Tax=Acropora millepora TaxID=45264 RepID=UPI001CF41E5C|nr:uncharacterized protein LOC122962993 [Acropora millepora]